MYVEGAFALISISASTERRHLGPSVYKLLPLLHKQNQSCLKILSNLYVQ